MRFFQRWTAREKQRRRCLCLLVSYRKSIILNARILINSIYENENITERIKQSSDDESVSFWAFSHNNEPGNPFSFENGYIIAMRNSYYGNIELLGISGNNEIEQRSISLGS